MAGVTTYTCNKCRPVDTEIIEAYLILTNTSTAVSQQEAGRVAAENARVLAEQGRTQQFAEDHGVAQEDHRIASGDHTLAVADHGTASDDHVLAVADHGTASDDHTASTSATTRANNAAAAAEHMVDIHQGPPGPAGKAPVVGANGNWWTWDDETEAYVDSGEQAQGPEGDPGATPDISIGTVTTGAAGSPAAASMTGTAESPVLNLTIPQGIQGNTGSSVDYPFELVNNETTDDATKAHSAAGAKRLKDEISQLEAEVDVLVANMKVLYNALGAGAFWGNKPVIDWGGEDVPVIRNLTHCTCDNEDDSVQIGDSYYAEITPDSGYILGSVLCSMGSTSVSVVNGVIDIDEVTGPITITASGINLDSVAFDGKTYKQIFETNNALGISPGFESGSYSPMTVNAGSPTITTEDADSGTYSLKASGTSSAQLKTGNKSGAAFIACRVKVTSYVQGICGCQFDQNAGVSSITDGWVTKYANRTATSQLVCYVGSFNSANLTGYVDTPVVILKSSFSTVPTFDEFKALYDQYVAIKKAV